MIWLHLRPHLSHQIARPATHRKTEKERQLADGKGGRRWGRSKIIRRRESLFLFILYVISALPFNLISQYTFGKEFIDRSTMSVIKFRKVGTVALSAYCSQVCRHYEQLYDFYCCLWRYESITQLGCTIKDRSKVKL